MDNLQRNITEVEVEFKDEYSRGMGYRFTKRLMDILGAAFGLIISSPIFLMLSIIIKIDSKGPVFFGQERVGLNGQKFKMYKFRSMVIDAEEKLKDLKDKNEMSGPMFKMKEDPRITKIGKFIRKTSLDELPQLINVLKGEMSLVGPRPSLPKEVQQFTDYQKLRLKVIPGLTCYWQVCGRSNVDFEEWMEMDVQYCRDRSLWLDFKLILKTVRVLFGDENAA